MEQISVIIPIYNEEKTIGLLVKQLLSCEGIFEIIVVDDGSRDNSYKKLLTIKAKKKEERLKIIHNQENKGKGWALSLGIKEAKKELLIFLDGDILIIGQKEIEKLVYPLINKEIDMVLGLGIIGGKKYYPMFRKMTGIRALWKKEVEKYLEEIKTKGYGVELFINELYKNKKVILVDLPDLKILPKYGKYPINKCVKSYCREGKDLIRELYRQRWGIRFAKKSNMAVLGE